MQATRFPNYTNIPSRLPIAAWQVIRVGSVIATLTVVLALFVAPDTGLTITWELAIPLLPLLFLVAPGLWRNICPLAASNQTPRVLGFTRALTAPNWLREYGYVVAITVLAAAISLRKPVFQHSGLATALLLLAALAGAFIGGLFLKGKSGWCSSICPLLPVQRIYGQTPLALVPNTHCQPCVGCTKNCYDFNPRVAYLADLNDNDRYFSGYRKFFAGAFPGLVLAFFNVPSPPEISIFEMYGRYGLFIIASAGSFYALESFIKVTTHKLTTLYAAAAFGVFYWYSGPAWIKTVTGHGPPAALKWGLYGAIFALTALWVLLTYRKERHFHEEVGGHATDRTASMSSGMSLVHHSIARAGDPEVTVVPEGTRVVARAGATLLEVAEANGMPIEAGCRMGVCGADPVAIKDGMENLSPVSGDERGTLERLGLADNTRMACCCRLSGPVTVSLSPEQPKRPTSSQILGFPFDVKVKRIVVIGNGIAGVTAAHHVRRRHPTCQVDLIADEPRHLYNRMAISRLIYGRSAMQGLYLNPDTWYDDRVITPWLNTQAESIDRMAGKVTLRTGEELPYDRVIIATGSSSAVPVLEGFGADGTFVLRSANDAFAIRAYVQRYGCRRAVVAGGGLLGLEAGSALHKLGLDVTIIERSGHLLRRQLDERAADVLKAYIKGLGLEVILNAQAQAVVTNGRAHAVALADGRSLSTDVFLVSAGITPNTDLATNAGLDVGRGVIVDDHMRTSDEAVFAAGDVAEHHATVYGLWPAAVEQAEVAGDNAVGGSLTYEGTVPVTILKVVGIELSSIGRFDKQSDEEEEILLEDRANLRYRKIVVSEGRIVGAILLGYAGDVSLVTTAVKRGFDVTSRLAELRRGNWGVLAELAPGDSLSPAAAAHPASG